MVVGKGVNDVFAVATEFHETALLQRSQLVGNGALRGAYGFGQVGNAQLGAHEGVQDFDARGVGEDFEQVGKVVQKLFVGHFVDSRPGAGTAAWQGGIVRFARWRCRWRARFRFTGDDGFALAHRLTFQHMSNCS